MIYRKIFKTKTAGSKKTGDLRPIISDTLPKGFNYAVLEYIADGMCIVEVWCSDSSILTADEQKDQRDLAAFSQNAEEIIDSHRHSPPVLARIAVAKTQDLEVDKTKRTVKFRGKSSPYQHVEKTHTSTGKEEEIYIIDEG